MGERTVKPLSEATFQEEWQKKKKKSLAQKQTNEPQLAITCSNSGRPAVAEGFSGWHQRTESDLVGESYKESQGLSGDYVAL